MWMDIEEVNFEELGRFDYVFALAVLYYIGIKKHPVGSQEALDYRRQIVSRIQTDKFIVRTRVNENTNVAFFDKFFKSIGFIRTKGKQEGRRGLVCYERKNNLNK